MSTTLNDHLRQSNYVFVEARCLQTRYGNTGHKRVLWWIEYVVLSGESTHSPNLISSSVYCILREIKQSNRNWPNLRSVTHKRWVLTNKISTHHAGATKTRQTWWQITKVTSRMTSRTLCKRSVDRINQKLKWCPFVVTKWNL